MANEPGENRMDGNAAEATGQNAQPGRSGRDIYEIRVDGHLDSKWLEWLEGLEVQRLENGEMILCGTIVDQAALMGILNKLAGLNLALLSVNIMKRKD